MNKILRVNAESGDSSEEINEIANQYPVNLRSVVKRAFQEAENEKFEKAAELCCNLLDEKVEPGIMMLLGISYFMQNHMLDARQVFADIVIDDPENEEALIYLGMTDHALGRYEEAVKELGSLYPLRAYHPFYYTSYGDSLQQIGKLKQSCDIFRKETEFYEETKRILSAPMLDGAFQNLIYLDVTLGNGKYPEDIKLYYEFLEQTDMTEEMQECLARNIMYFSSLMSNKWYRPLFLEFITYIQDKGFLTMEESLMALEAAFVKWEFYAYHDDRQITPMMEAYLAAGITKRYITENRMPAEENSETEILALTYEWYMCQYAPEHMEEINYVEITYPHTYAQNKDFFKNIKNNPIDTAEKIEGKLYSYTKKVSREEFHESMRYSYIKACENKKEPVYIYDGMDSYRRMQPKIGRNDPCPCGSGKKYKKCCGR